MIAHKRKRNKKEERERTRVQQIILEMYKEIADIFVLKTISPIEKYALMTQLRNNNEMEQKSSKTRDVTEENIKKKKKRSIKIKY